MKGLTDKATAIQIIEQAQIKPLEGKELITLLEYIFYITSSRTTMSDYVAAAKIAAKFFHIEKHVEKLSSWFHKVDNTFVLTSPKKGK
jgi:hypothetical protein